MKFQAIFVFILMVFSCLLGLSQESLIEKNPININAKYCNADNVEKLLRKNKDLRYEDMQIQELRLQIWDNNAAIDKKQQELINNRNYLIGVRQQIVQIGNPELINDRIKEKQAGIEKINSSIRDNLAGLGYKGIFLFACKTTSSYDSEKELHDKAMHFLTPLAVEKTNGFFISSITELQRKEGYDDKLYRFIREVVQGTSNVEAEIINKHNRKDGYYIFMAKLNTKPLQKSVQAVATTEYGIPQDAIVYDAIRDKNMSKKLIELGILKEDVKKIEQETNKWKDIVAAENLRIKEIEKNFILSGNDRINEIYREIDKLKAEYDANISALQKLIAANTKTVFNAEAIEKTIEEAIEEIDLNISEIDKQIMNEETNRLYADYQVLVTTNTDYYTKIAEESVAQKDRLTEMYSTVEHYVKIVEMENDDYRKATGNDEVYQRYFDKMWVFPEPGDGDFFRVTVVVKFSLTKTKPAWKIW